MIEGVRSGVAGVPVAAPPAAADGAARTAAPHAIPRRPRAVAPDVPSIRLAIVAFCTAVYLFLMADAGAVPRLAWATIGAGWAWSAAALVLGRRARRSPLLSPFATMIADAALITAWLAATGGAASPFFVLWYAAIAAMAFRQSGVETLIATAVYTAAYLGLLAALRQIADRPVELVVRAGLLALVGIGTHLLAREAARRAAARVERTRAQLGPLAEALDEAARQRVESLAHSEQRMRAALDELTAAHERLQARAAQQTALAGFAQRALAGADPATLIHEIADLIARTLRADQAAIFERSPGGDALVLRAGAGWPHGAIGRATLPGHGRRPNEFTLFDYALACGEPVVIDDVRADGRFVPPALLTDTGVRGGVAVTIDGDAAPFGLVGAFAGTPRAFTHGDALFLQAAARVLALGVQRSRADAARTRLSAIVEATTDFVAVTDVQGNVTYLNEAARNMLWCAPGEDVQGLWLPAFLPDGARERVLDEGIPAALRDGVWSGETAFRSRDGRETPVLHVILAHRGPDGAVECLSTIARDISERKALEAELVHQAGHDPLTGLVNRRRFEEDLERHLEHAARYSVRGAVLFVDLDQFKDVNDSLGHLAGDEFLQSLATALRDRVRKMDVLARLGGDEFGIVLPYAEREQAELVAAHVLDAVRRHAIVLRGKPVAVTASIGVALYPDHGATVGELLACADLAMYQAKQSGRNRIAVHTPDADWRAEAASRLAWQQRIREALDGDRFLSHVQPILYLRDNAVATYELLLRMTGEAGEVILPEAFLGVAERGGLIQAIDRWVVRRAIQIIAEQQRAGRRVSLGVNLSARAVADPDLLRLIEREVIASGIDPASLLLEITESAAIADTRQAQQFIETLKALGCRFALDDFGVGFTSLHDLKHLPVDYLKIDGSFIRDLPRSPVDQHLVKAIVEAARGLGKQTIAVYVGDEETLALLREYGVDYAQGYHVGRPLDVSAIRAVPPAAADGAGAPPLGPQTFLAHGPIIVPLPFGC